MTARTGVFQYATLVYEKFLELSELTPAERLIEFGYPAQPNEEVRIYRGFSTKDSQSVGLSIAGARHAMRLLAAMQCLTLLKAGGQKTPSIYIIHYKPTEKQFKEFKERSAAAERKIAPNKYDTVIDDLIRLRERVSALEKWRAELEGSDDRYHVRPGQTLPDM